MFFGTLSYGESSCVIYFCCLEFLYKIDSLKEYSLATDIGTSFTCFMPQYITQKNLVFIFFLWSRTS